MIIHRAKRSFPALWPRLDPPTSFFSQIFRQSEPYVFRVAKARKDRRSLEIGVCDRFEHPWLVNERLENTTPFPEQPSPDPPPVTAEQLEK